MSTETTKLKKLMEITVPWLSRHEATDEQTNDFVSLCRDNFLFHPKLVQTNITWVASDNSVRDIMENTRLWEDLLAKHKVIAGVFPPVALEALPWRQAGARPALYSPVSEQAPELRVGNGPIPFRHLRWCRVR